ncbi:MAG: hypothetical protein ACRDKC_02330 [Gaiellaceae bacterium]
MRLALFVHVLGAMTLYGTVIAALVTSLAGLRSATVRALLAAVPAWAVTLAGAYWVEHDDHLGGSNVTWLKVGHNILEPGVLVLLLAILASWWWVRTNAPRAGRIVAALSGVYLVLLTIALLAMSGKWGS